MPGCAATRSARRRRHRQLRPARGLHLHLLHARSRAWCPDDQRSGHAPQAGAGEPRAALRGMVTAMMVARRTPWFRAYAWLAIATGIGFFLRLVTSLAIMHGTVPDRHLYDLAWIAAFSLYRHAALAAPDSPKEAGPGGRPTGSPPHALAALAGLSHSSHRLRRALHPAARRRRRFVPRAADRIDDRCGPRRADAATGGAGRRAAAGGRAHAAARGRHRADRRSDPDHARRRRLRARERRVRPRARLLASRARRLRVRRPRSSAGSGTLGATSAPRSAIAASGAARSLPAPSRRLDVPGRVHGGRPEGPGGRITHFVGVERDIDRGAQAARSARAQRAALGDRRARGRRRARDQQSAPDDHRLGRADAGGAVRRPGLPPRSRDRPPGGGARAGRSSGTCCRSCAAALPIAPTADLNDIVRATSSSCAGYHLQQQEHHARRPSCSRRPLPVLVNREEIQQIILNLMLNAEQAMRLGRKTAARSPSAALPNPATTGRRSGRRRPGDQRARCGGESSSRSSRPRTSGREPGWGSRFPTASPPRTAGRSRCSPRRAGRLLPAGAAGAPARRRADPWRPRRGPRHVLIVDDEAPIRKLLSRLLERRGFDVLEAETAEAALGDHRCDITGARPLRCANADVARGGSLPDDHGTASGPCAVLRVHHRRPLDAGR